MSTTSHVTGDSDPRSEHSRGEVTIIGAGPGDPALITVRGREAARRADAIIHDELVDRQLLATLGDAERHTFDNDDGAAGRLERLRELYSGLAGRGMSVARLKGGDPMMFARIAEELTLLRELGIRYRVVPGVTAATAAAAYAELPLTRRGSGRSVALVTGHAPLSPAGATAPLADTLCVYMGGDRSRQFCSELEAGGWRRDTPLVAVAHASLPQQRVLESIVGDVADGSATVPSGPVVIVVGRGAMPLSSPGWFALGPRILVTGTSADPYLPYGEVVHTPLIETVPPEDRAPLDSCVARLTGYDWVAFTSPAAVDALTDAVISSGGDGRSFAGISLAAVGAATAEALRARGLSADLVATRESAEGLADALVARMQRDGERSMRVLLPRSDLADGALPDRLRSDGCHIETVVAYRTRLPAAERIHRIDLADIDIVAFASPSAVRNFVAIYGASAPSHLAVLARGDRTAVTAHELLGNRPFVGLDDVAGWVRPPAVDVNRSGR